MIPLHLKDLSDIFLFLGRPTKYAKLQNTNLNVWASYYF